MAKPDGRVEAGQSLKRAISAQRWNDLCDAADIVHGRRGGVTQADIRGPALSYVPVLVRNDGTANIEKGESLAITGLVIQPTGTVGGVDVIVVGDEPSNNDETDQPFVVAVEPIAQNAIGRAAIDGVVVAKLNVTDSDHAGVIPTNAAPFLKSRESGPATIVWKESGTGNPKWALVHLGRVAPVAIDVLTGASLGDALSFGKATVQFQAVLATGTTTIAVTGC